KGVVIATIDSGVQWDHPAIKDKYRGYNTETGEVDHNFNWFDAVTGQTTPFDDIAHGTHVTGTMVGSETNGTNAIGVAPGAKWIAVKAFSADGGEDADLLEAAEWILAPRDKNGNTRVDMAPDIVNNSWSGGPGLDEWYRDVVTEWRNANIFPLFAAGNTTMFNPGGPESISNPANYPESFAVGATNVNNSIANFSLRGPSPYGEIKPDISAPGVNIRSSIPGGKYEGGWNGTSMAAPAVAGVIALLYEVNNSLTID
ncbi:S8 family serine peptidase, partial [Microvirga sp. 3-52]|nr:S8 family serine peptidase [Microvirga sp. 3-52]